MTDDYRLENLERTQLEKTRRRRKGRSQRYYRMLLFAVIAVGLVVLAAPSIISHTGLAHAMLRRQAASYGWEAKADSIDVGWVTPLAVRNLVLVGLTDGTRIEIQQVDTTLKVGDLVRLDGSQLGEVTVRGAHMEADVFNGGSSIESDMSTMLSNESGSSATNAEIKIQDFSAKIRHRESSLIWKVEQANSAVSLSGTQTNVSLSGLLSAPDGTDGSLQCEFGLNSDHGGSQDQSNWKLGIDTQSFPLSVADLITTRFRDQASGSPEYISGHSTGKLVLKGYPDGALEAEILGLQVRNFQASTESTWSNTLATVDGRIALSEGRFFSENLNVTTDFAAARLDGAFPASISMAGSGDNPLRWLQSLDGKALVEVDLPAFEKAMPGLIPLRQDAVLVSGRAKATIENVPGAAGERRSQFMIESGAVRARSAGRAVVLSPIRFTATVADIAGNLRAEEFKLQSDFATGSGRGALRAGHADLQVDFGQLYTTIRPILDLSELSLGGDADIEVDWNVAAQSTQRQQTWNLTARGTANQLLVTLPDGQRFKRNFIQGSLLTRGLWSGNSLDELSVADFEMASGGVSLTAQLTEPVSAPSLETAFPIALTIDGRLENLGESLRPWLPEVVGDLEGRITGSALAAVGRTSGSLSQADFKLTQLRIHYGDAWYRQPEVDVAFKGVYAWPSGNLHTETFTATGQSLSLAVRGDASPEKTHLEVAWDVDLRGLSESVERTLAHAAMARPGETSTNPPVRPIAFRSGGDDRQSLHGTSRGKLTAIRVEGGWVFDAEANGENVAIVSSTRKPTTSGSAIQSGLRGRGSQASLETLWAERKLRMVGSLRYDDTSARLSFDRVDVTTDWLAGSYGGEVQLGAVPSIRCSGPTQIQMERFAQRISAVSGVPCVAEGIHKSNWAFQYGSQKADEATTFKAQGSIGWDALSVPTLEMGPVVVPLSVDLDKTQFGRVQIPVRTVAMRPNQLPSSASFSEPSAAILSVAGQVRYAASPVLVELEKGSTVTDLRVTSDAASSWLRYLAPLAADATRIDGVMNARVEEALIAVDDPAKSRVRGALKINGLSMSSGPTANLLIQGVDQIKSLGKLSGAQPGGGTVPSMTLIKMPPQTVEFAMENGVVSHQRMYFDIDRASLMTSGQVGLDSRMNLVAQVPLDPRWLGSDLKGLAGQTITLPITGTLSRPQLDSRGIRALVTELGTRAGAEVMQNRLDGLIQKQFGSSLDQINNGLEKVFGF